jgi:hypothetical protein
VHKHTTNCARAIAQLLAAATLAQLFARCRYGAPIYVYCNKWPAGKKFSVASLCGTMWIMFAPLLFSLLTCNFWSLWFLFWGFVPYYLFLPTMVGTFTLYAVAQS